MTTGLKGVHCAVATPVLPDGTIATGLFLDHCRALLEEGCHGLAPLGTTGEASNFGLSERMGLLDAMAEGGIDPGLLVPGTGALSVPDTVALTAHAVQAGAKGALVLPPFYYKEPDEEGLYRFYSRVIEGVSDDRLRLVLYHIPQISLVPIGHELIARLMAAFPGIVSGIKDSSGSLENMQALCARFPGLAVFSGADPLMLAVLEAGGAGCITAASNIAARPLRRIWDNWRDGAGSAGNATALAEIKAWRSLSTSYAQIPTTKAMIGRVRGDPTWGNLRPPFVPISDAARAEVFGKMAELGR
jgi:4-hydroxy-tetrahydrodipicolinate synthase